MGAKIYGYFTLNDIEQCFEIQYTDRRGIRKTFPVVAMELDMRHMD